MNRIVKTEDDLFLQQVLGSGLDADGRQIIATMLSHSEDEIDAIIPSDISPSDLVRHIEALCSTHNLLNKASDNVKPIIGSFLRFVQLHPNMLEHFVCDIKGEVRACSSFTEFMNFWVPSRLKLKRQDSFTLLRVANEYPHMRPEDIREVGPAKLKLVANAIPSGVKDTGRIPEPVKQKRDEVIRVILDQNLRYDDTVQYLGEQHLIPQEQVEFKRIEIPANQDIYRQWEQFRKDKNVRLYCGSEAPSIIFQTLMSECWSLMQAHGAVMENRRNDDDGLEENE